MAQIRGRNEGTIHKRPNGTWRAQVSLDGKRMSFSAATRQECQGWLKKTIHQIDGGLTFTGAQTTYKEFLEDWLVSLASRLRPATVRQYNMTIRRYIIPVIGRIKLKDLRPDQIQNLYDAKVQDGCGPRTVQVIHAVIHRSLAHALKLGLIIRNPAAVVTPPKSSQKEMKIYDESQVNQMLLAARGNRNEALYNLAVTTGLRQGELLGLRWNDLDWEKRSLQVGRQLKRKFRKGDYFEYPKTKAGRRTIILGSKTIEKLQEHWKCQNQERVLAGERWQENDLIFPTPIGTPMDHSNLYRAFKDFIRQAGLPEIRFHDIRHTAASLMLNHGTPVIVVSRRLGHSKASITLDIYGHLIPEMQNDVAEMMDELISPAEIHLHQTAPERIGLIEK